MKCIIRPFLQADKPKVMEMMREFYASDAVYTNGSDEIFSSDIDSCLSDSPYIDGYVIDNLGEIQGYAMVAKSFSTEFGKPCIWIEDIYIGEAYRGAGLGKMVMDFIMRQYTDCIFRLEVEEENGRAVKLYRACGFTVLPYMEMKK